MEYVLVLLVLTFKTGSRLISKIKILKSEYLQDL